MNSVNAIYKRFDLILKVCEIITVKRKSAENAIFRKIITSRHKYIYQTQYFTILS